MRSHALLDDLKWRGLLYQNTDEVADALSSGPISGYIGFDPTAASLHIGSLLQIMLLVRLQKHGHRPVALVGGGTGLIGDPGGKAAERPLSDAATVSANTEAIRKQLERFLDFSGSNAARMIDNAEWLVELRAIDFMRDVGKHFTVNYMLAKDSVKGRMESGISYTEFSYMLLQAFDFVHLSRAHGCRLQVGGSDQYGNITAGCELSRKMGGPQLFGLTAPLLLDSTGQKMGKTATGERVWLDTERTSPYAFYQYFFNVTDEEAPRLLKLFSFRPLTELDELLRTHDADRGPRLAQRELAREFTTWVHGAEETARVEEASRIMFGGSLDGVHERTLELLTKVVPVVEVDRNELANGIPLLDLLCRTVADSKSAARRLVQQGGAYVNNVRVTDAERKIGTADLITPTLLVVRGGRKDYRLVRAAGTKKS